MNVYDQFTGEDLKIAEKIKQRRLQMLVHSYIYYERDSNIVSDYKWSEWAMELVSLQHDYPDIAKVVDYANDFKDWNGSTGAFLNYSVPAIVSAGEYLLNLHNPKPKPKVTQPPAPAKNQKPVRKKLF